MRLYAAVSRIIANFPEMNPWVGIPPQNLISLNRGLNFCLVIAATVVVIVTFFMPARASGCFLFLLHVHLMRSICREGRMQNVTGVKRDIYVFRSDFLAGEWQFDTFLTLMFRLQEYMVQYSAECS